jgi:hypothetical protein
MMKMNAYVICNKSMLDTVSKLSKNTHFPIIKFSIFTFTLDTAAHRTHALPAERDFLLVLLTFLDLKLNHFILILTEHDVCLRYRAE